MDKDLLFYKDRAGWKYVDQNKPTANGTFINPLPNYRIKHIYCDEYIIVWYWPVKTESAVDQKIVIINFKSSIDYLSGNELIDFKKIHMNIDAIFESGFYAEQNDKKLTVGICTLSDPIEYIRHSIIVFFITEKRIIVFGNNIFKQIDEKLDVKLYSFRKFDLKPAVVRDIYLNVSSLFIHMIDGEILCRGFNDCGQLGIGYSIDSITCNGKVDQNRIKATDFKLRKIVCCLDQTLFWYEHQNKSRIYIVGNFNNTNYGSLNLIKTDAAKKVFNVLSSRSTFIIVYRKHIEIYNTNNKQRINFVKKPIQRIISNKSKLYVATDHKIYTFNERNWSTSKYVSDEQYDVFINKIQLTRWFDQLPYVHYHWDIIRTLFAGHYLCFESPLYKSRLPMDVLKLVVEFLAYWHK